MLSNFLENIRKLKHQGNISDAIRELEKLVPRETELVERFTTMIELVELYCKFDKVVEAYTSIERLRKLVEAMKIPEDYLSKLRIEAFEEEKYVRSFLYTVCQKCDVSSEDTSEVPQWIYNVVAIVNKMKMDYSLLCMQLVLPLIVDMAEYLQIPKKSNTTLVINKAWLMYGAAVCKGYLGEISELVTTSKATCQMMEKYLGKETAPLYRVYGLSLANQNDNKGASTALTMASDWSDNSVKEKCLKLTKM